MISYLIAGSAGLMAPFVIVFGYELIKQIPRTALATLSLYALIVLMLPVCFTALYQGNDAMDAPVSRILVWAVMYVIGYRTAVRIVTRKKPKKGDSC